MAEAKKIVVVNKELNQLALRRSNKIGEIIMEILQKTGREFVGFNIVPLYDGVSTEINIYGGAR